MLAVPVRRSSILLAKFILVAIWSVGLTIVILIVGMIMGAVTQTSGRLDALFSRAAPPGDNRLSGDAVVMPFALFASVGKEYLLPMGSGSHGDHGKPGGGSGWGILPLVGARTIFSRARISHRSGSDCGLNGSGRHVWDLSVVDVCRSEPLDPTGWASSRRWFARD
jgi:hypothetical protein